VEERADFVRDGSHEGMAGGGFAVRDLSSLRLTEPAEGKLVAFLQRKI
jgi:hypothetical protein